MEANPLQTFVALLSEGSFAAAAALLQEEPSEVERCLLGLERSLGTRLVHRGPPLRPTRSGRTLLTFATRLVRLREEPQPTGEVPPAELTVAADATAVEVLLPAALATLERTHPHLQVTVQTSSAQAALDAVVGGGCDLALVLGPVSACQVVTLPVCTLQFGVYGAPDRVGDRFVTCPPPLGPPLPEGARAGIRMASSWAARQCIVEGAGVAYLPAQAVADEVERGRLQRVPWPGTPTARMLEAVHPVATVPRSATAALLGALVA
jgi:DNA-binding transcriptional LysR family regulator